VTFRTILVGVDGSKPSSAAVDIAAEIARRYDATLILLHALSVSSTSKALEELAEYQRVENLRLTLDEALKMFGQSILASAEKAARDKGVENVETMAEIGDPASTIAAVAKAREADLIVVGRRGLGDIAGLMMGSVSHKLIQLADRPCLTIP
jgi:nucleotide-binding universal stress UspA family protein